MEPENTSDAGVSCCDCSGLAARGSLRQEAPTAAGIACWARLALRAGRLNDGGREHQRRRYVEGLGLDRTHWQGTNDKERSVAVASGLPGAQKNVRRHAASPCTDFA